MNAEQFKTWLHQQSEQIVQRGKNVRQEIAQVVARANEQAHRSREGLVALSRAVLEGAAAGARQSAPAQTAGTLQEVVAGLAEGFQISAQALKLTLDEARTRGTPLPKEDIDAVAKDLSAVSEHFAKTVSEVVHKVGGQLSAHAQALGEHAGRAMESARPSLESAIRAAGAHPGALGREAVQAGAAAAREATAVLFGELAKHLEKAGQQLRSPPK